MGRINGIFSVKGESGKTYAFNMYTPDTEFKTGSRICICTNRYYSFEKKMYFHKILSVEKVEDMSKFNPSSDINVNCICVRQIVEDADKEVNDIKKII